MYVVPISVIAAVVLGSPIWGYVAIAADGSRFATAAPDSDPAATIPVAGSMFLATFLSLAILAIAWLVGGRRFDGFTFGYSLVALVLALMASLSISARGRAAEVASWEFWVIPPIASAALGALLALVMFVLRLRHQASDSLSFKAANLLADRRDRLASISADETARIRSDLEAAIADLEQRGVITPATAARAREIELGGLGLRMPRKAR
ncbi:hypothetical protein OH146_04165 [Salinibacterium sp. SYSU T00001]|uniref:hypothetical protein n=1 Tax=Homoserinimonas sedimenticola TaxID=2986805 RepID=UPI002235C313|nr:hypothetical protein [Salinibacterium sedimenticola]MCW4384965.1 hypothetical protein [Salinibacterium sedimenticola]